MGILANDNEWKECLIEAVQTMAPSALRQLFCVIIVNNNPANIVGLWEMNIPGDINQILKHYMAEDFKHRRLSSDHHTDLFVNQIDIDISLTTINSILLGLTNDQRGLQYYGLPQPPPTEDFFAHTEVNNLIADELRYFQTQISLQRLIIYGSNSIYLTKLRCRRTNSHEHY